MDDFQTLFLATFQNKKYMLHDNSMHTYINELMKINISQNFFCVQCPLTLSILIILPYSFFFKFLIQPHLIDFLTPSCKDQQTTAQGPNTTSHLFLYGVWVRNGFLISKWLGGKSKEYGIYDTWKLYEIRISVSINKRLLEPYAHLFMCFLWSLSHCNGRVK